MMEVRRLARAAILAVVLGAAAVPPGAAAAPLTESERLTRIYDQILDARFGAAERAIEEACPPAPAVACDVLSATALWWRLQLDEHATDLDAEFLRRVEQAIEAAERWTEREPERAEAWFYLGGAYGARAQYLVLRGERVAAARDGKRIKGALEQALELDPELADARFGIGLYKYYADVAPSIAKFLRFLLLLPGGDRAEGLQDMRAAQAGGTLLQGEADYQLHWIYFWYEQQPQRGLELLQRLHRQYPHNPVFLQRIAEVQTEYFHDRAASLASWKELLAAAEAGRVAAPALSAARARLGLAAQLDALHETDRAIDVLEQLLAAKPEAPFAIEARARVQLGEALDRMGRRDLAVQQYRAALDAVPDRDPFDVEARAQSGLRAAPDPRRADAYRLALEGWRGLQRGDAAAAASLLDRSLTLAPDEPVALYRRARVDVARKDREAALRRLDRVIAAQPPAPPDVLGPAHLDRGQLLEGRGDRAAALAAYRAAAGVFGADGRVKARARREADRLARTAPPQS